MALPNFHSHFANYRKRVIAWVEAWAKPHTQSVHRQADSISLKLAEGRHVILLAPQHNVPIVILLLAQLDSSNRDNGFPDRFVNWLREGGDDPMPDAVYAPHLNSLGYGISIPIVDWPIIETQYLPMVDFVFGLLAQLQRCYQAVRDLDLDGDCARVLREQFHSESFIRREVVRVSCIPMNWALAMH